MRRAWKTPVVKIRPGRSPRPSWDCGRLGEFVAQRERAAGGIDGVQTDGVGELAGGDQEAAEGVTAKTARLRLRGPVADERESQPLRIDSEASQRRSKTALAGVSKRASGVRRSSAPRTRWRSRAAGRRRSATRSAGRRRWRRPARQRGIEFVEQPGDAAVRVEGEMARTRAAAGRRRRAGRATSALRARHRRRTAAAGRRPATWHRRSGC